MAAGDAPLHRDPRVPATHHLRRLVPVRCAVTGAWPSLVALLAYLGLTLLLFSGIWRSSTTSWVGGDGDPQLFIWNLRWIPFGLAHGSHHPLVTNYLDFPQGVNLMWNTSVVLPSILLWPVTVLLGPVFAYNLLVTLALALSAWCAYLAARRLLGTALGGFVGGLLYGFSPFMIAQVAGHLHVGLALYPPLALILLHEILVTQRHRALVSGAVLGVLTAMQLLTGEEILATSAVVAVVGVTVLAAVNHRAVAARARHAVLALSVAGACFAVLAAYPLEVQFLGPQHIGGRLVAPDVYVSDILAFVVPTPSQHFSTPGAQAVVNHMTGNASEVNAYLGIPLLLFLAVAIPLLWRRRTVRWAAISGLVIAVLSMGPHLHVNGTITRIPLPWHLIGAQTPLDNVQPSRMMLYGYLFLGLIIAAALAEARRRGARRFALAGAATVLALLPLFPAYPFPNFDPPVPRFFTADAGRIPAGSVVLISPYASAASGSSRAMLWQAEAGMHFRMAEGEAFQPIPTPSLNPPPTYTAAMLSAFETGQPAPPVDGHAREVMLADLRMMRVGTVIVGPSRGEARALEMFREVLGRDPERIDGVHVWFGLESGAPAPTAA